MNFFPTKLHNATDLMQMTVHTWDKLTKKTLADDLENTSTYIQLLVRDSSIILLSRTGGKLSSRKKRNRFHASLYVSSCRTIWKTRDEYYESRYTIHKYIRLANASLWRIIPSYVNFSNLMKVTERRGSP